MEDSYHSTDPPEGSSHAEFSLLSLCCLFSDTRQWILLKEKRVLNSRVFWSYSN